MTDEEMQNFIHKISDMISLDDNEIEKIKNMNVDELLKIIIILNLMYAYCLELIEEYI